MAENMNGANSSGDGVSLLPVLLETGPEWAVGQGIHFKHVGKREIQN